MHQNKYWLEKRSNRKTGFPVGTIAHYGPDNQMSSKVVVGIFLTMKEEPDHMKKWFSTEDLDTRIDENINAEIVDFLKGHNVERVVMHPKILGCPHEEGIDYPDGSACPQCPFWAAHDRFEGI